MPSKRLRSLFRSNGRRVRLEFRETTELVRNSQFLDQLKNFSKRANPAEQNFGCSNSFRAFLEWTERNRQLIQRLASQLPRHLLELEQFHSGRADHNVLLIY